MKRLLQLVCVAVVLVSSAWARPTIFIGREIFVLISQDQDKQSTLREFVLAQETSENSWSRLVTIRQIKTVDEPKQYIAAMAQEYQKQNHGLKFDLFQNKATGAWIFDFIMLPEDSKNRFVEWNVFRTQRVAQGIVVYQYAARLYFKESATEVQDAFVKLRREMAPIVYAADFQVM